MMTFVEAYGGFGESQKPKLSKSNLAIMNLFGAMIAYPHIRGGGELGQDWHDQGRK